ncbi:MAG TPA: GTP-dependent dephospho-CoA kinase family protein, partial [Candidatus Thermoplasmatota archaeon]|nr:GTP-dependent dephospho-CoA kinase family protein [Candidatus Thermoplasmatota archaeon]
KPRLIVCDYRTRRGAPSAAYRAALGSWGTQEIRVANQAGALTREAWDAVRDALGRPPPHPVRIVVDGEEDLLGIPCFLEAADGTSVLYGMPRQGVVVARVDAAFKAKVRRIVARLNAG